MTFKTEYAAWAWLQRRAPGCDPAGERDPIPAWDSPAFPYFWIARTPYRPASAEYMREVAAAARDERMAWGQEPGILFRRGLLPDGRGCCVHPATGLRVTLGKAERWELKGKRLTLAELNAVFDKL